MKCHHKCTNKCINNTDINLNMGIILNICKDCKRYFSLTCCYCLGPVYTYFKCGLIDNNFHQLRHQGHKSHCHLVSSQTYWKMRSPEKAGTFLKP